MTKHIYTVEVEAADREEADAFMARVARLDTRFARAFVQTYWSEGAGIVLTKDQLEAWSGATLDQDQLDALAEAIPNSSVPEAIDTIAHDALGIPYDEDEEN